jgi:hypothetical protein
MAPRGLFQRYVTPTKIGLDLAVLIVIGIQGGVEEAGRDAQ